MPMPMSAPGLSVIGFWVGIVAARADARHPGVGEMRRMGDRATAALVMVIGQTWPASTCAVM
jgi:hypothetical protein